jgi:tRNA1(Val) A37 N6-methylase TrmN6
MGVARRRRAEAFDCRPRPHAPACPATAPNPPHPPYARTRPSPERSKAITTYEEGEAEYDLVFKVISHMIKRDGLLVVVTAPRRAANEGADAFRNRVWKERRLALSPSYVPE